MAPRKLGLMPPDLNGLSEDQAEYVRLLELAATSPVVTAAEPPHGPWDPRTWPISTHLALVGLMVGAFAWAFSSGGQWRDLQGRIDAANNRMALIEQKQAVSDTTYARRDLLEQQMSYVVSGLNELKLKVDNLTTAARR